MSRERYEALVRSVCQTLEVPDAEGVLDRRPLSVEGFDVLLDHVAEDPNAFYIQFDYGITTAGRTMRVFRMMLESNLLVYAQDQAQLAINPDTGGALLILRVPISDDIDSAWVAETFRHYAEHGRYWRNNMCDSTEEMFEGIVRGDYAWLAS
jgi:hypothetical protein